MYVNQTPISQLWRVRAAVGTVLVYSLLPLVASCGQMPAAGPLWSADHETGDLSQWTQGQEGEAVFNTGTGSVNITDAVAHSGRYALELSIRNAAGQVQAARIFRWYENPEEAYYSTWFFFPQFYEPGAWWDVFQFKSKPDDGESEPMWVLDVGNLDVGNLDGGDPNSNSSEDGEMVFYLWDALNERAYEDRLAPLTIPVGRWVHVEAFYERATDETGHIAVWQDGVKLFDLDGVQTAIADNVHWSLNNYTDDIVPSDVTLYVDDAAISTTRTGGKHKKESAPSDGENPYVQEFPARASEGSCGAIF